MSTTTIKPTVGRVVWFYPAANQATSGFHAPTLNDPLAAIVAKVVGDRYLNLTVFDAHGFSHSMTSVPLIQEDQDVPADGYFATWMPYQIGQAKKAENETARADEPKVGAMAQSSQIIGAGARDDSFVRFQALDMALRTPGLQSHDDVLKAARAYQAHIEDEKTAEAGRDVKQMDGREQALEELLRAACAIADRKGEDTAWERFADSIRALGLNGVTARTYRVLPSDIE